jgi:hypothetical protein
LEIVAAVAVVVGLVLFLLFLIRPPKVEIVILPLPAGDTETCVSVDGASYCAPGRTKKDLPGKGDFTIDVDGDTYRLNARSPGGARLQNVYVVVGSKYVIGVYEEGVEDAEGVLRLATKDQGTCITCPNGATLCGHNPRCR